MWVHTPTSGAHGNTRTNTADADLSVAHTHMHTHCAIISIDLHSVVAFSYNNTPVTVFMPRGHLLNTNDAFEKLIPHSKNHLHLSVLVINPAFGARDCYEYR